MANFSRKISRMKKKNQRKKEEIAEDYCFECKDGGHLRVCDFKNCLKSYHPHCVGKGHLFLEDDKRWTCGLHSCSCGKRSSFQCFCCPTSFCNSCIRSAEFAEVKKKKKGFCINCLKLAKMIEDDENIDSDGEEVDFSNRETYEFLFMEYWEIIKDQEGLTRVDVQSANALLKGGENESDSDKLMEEESMSGSNDSEDDSDKGKPLIKELSRKRSRKKIQIKKPKNGRSFIGWASTELITFLAYVGKYTNEALSQVDVTNIIKEYIQSKDLFQPKRRRNYVISDEKLRTLFKKKKLKYHKIFDLVKKHLAGEQSDQSDGFSGSEDDEGTNLYKKHRSTNSDYKIRSSETNHCKKVLEISKSCYAAIVPDNIKLVYLKRSLVLELLKNPETFEDKVVGSFVRIKNDPKNVPYLMQKVNQLRQVTGIKKVEQSYNIGETTTVLVLCVSKFSKDVKISTLSDDNIEEEECEDLRQLVKKGLFKQPTIAELERKISNVHEDITNHWIDKELVRLQKQIDRANEKGWRRELHEYIDRRELLRTPAEQKRLVEEIPEVIPDMGDNEANANEQLNLQEVNKGKSDVSAEGPEEKPKGALHSVSKGELNGNTEENRRTKIMKKEEKYPKNSKASKIQFSDLDGDDNVDDGMASVTERDKAIWHYIDLSGNEQGPFTLSSLRHWKNKGYFDDDFMVWKSAQREEDAILLTVALASEFK